VWRLKCAAVGAGGLWLAHLAGTDLWRLVLLSLAVLALLVAVVLLQRQVRQPALRATVARPCAVYIIPSRGSRPAYVGEGYDPWRRIGCHRKAWWWPQVDTSREPVIEWHPSKAAARVREQELIGRLAPLFNDRHNLGRQVRPLSYPASTVAGWESRSRSASSSPGWQA